MSDFKITRNYNGFGSNCFNIMFKDVDGKLNHIYYGGRSDNIIELDDYDLCGYAYYRREEINTGIKKKAGRLGSQ